MRDSAYSTARGQRAIERAGLELRNNFAQSLEPAYDARMLSLLGRRGLEAGISVFALLGFCYVPLGRHTGLEHAKAIFSTPAARRAGSELAQGFARARSKLTGEALEFASGESTSAPSAQPEHGRPAGSRPEHPHHVQDPKPRLPHLGDANLHAAPREPQPASDADAPDASVPWHES